MHFKWIIKEPIGEATIGMRDVDLIFVGLFPRMFRSEEFLTYIEM